MVKHSLPNEQQKAVEHLTQIITTQAKLAEANFDVDNFMNLVVEQVEKLTAATGVVVELVEGDEMVYKAAIGSVKKHIGLRLAKNNSISGLCVASKKVLCASDTEHDERVNQDACRKVDARSLVVAPLFHEGEAVGVLKILWNKPNAFKDEDIHTLQLMASLIGSALRHQIYHDTTQKLLNERTKTLAELTQAEEKLQHIANHDYLTDLPNRGFFTDRLAKAIQQTQRHPHLIAVLFIDIDFFKPINDTWGHDVGDALLKAFSKRLTQSIRETDTAARFGGDEFVVLLDNLVKESDAIAIAEKIIAKMHTAFIIQDKTLVVGTSIGIAFCKDGTMDATQLIKNADTALYQAKAQGRGNFQVFNPEV